MSHSSFTSFISDAKSFSICCWWICRKRPSSRAQSSIVSGENLSVVSHGSPETQGGLSRREERSEDKDEIAVGSEGISRGREGEEQ